MYNATEKGSLCLEFSCTLHFYINLQLFYSNCILIITAWFFFKIAVLLSGFIQYTALKLE